jgi:CMP/dCMP kinase
VTVPVLAIDGPSGSGKGTISRRIATALGWHFLDSGALYRLVGLAGHGAGLAEDDEAGHARIARTMQVSFRSDAAGEERVSLDGVEVAARLRSELAGGLASKVATFAEVRKALVSSQHGFRKSPGLVADGRDMGTRIFPDAFLKIFLTASAPERARRRHKQLKDKGLDVSLADLSREIAERDLRDATRTVAPLVAAADAVLLDSTNLGVDDVVARVLALAHERRP